jgi:hypothetical protein
MRRTIMKKMKRILWFGSAMVVTALVAVGAVVGFGSGSGSARASKATLAGREVAASHALTEAPAIDMKGGQAHLGGTELRRRVQKVYSRIPTPNGFRGTGMAWAHKGPVAIGQSAWEGGASVSTVEFFEQVRAACEWYQTYLRTDASNPAHATAATVIADLPHWPRFRASVEADTHKSVAAAAAEVVAHGGAKAGAATGHGLSGMRSFVSDDCG